MKIKDKKPRWGGIQIRGTQAHKIKKNEELKKTAETEKNEALNNQDPRQDDPWNQENPDDFLCYFCNPTPSTHCQCLHPYFKNPRPPVKEGV